MFGAFMVGTMPIPQAMIDLGDSKVDKEVMMVHYQNEGLMGHPMHLHQPVGYIIAKDGHPLPQPQPTDTVWVSPGERYTVLYKGTDPGVWAWHCHILSHAEGPQGMFGMVTALIVTP